MKFWQTDFKKMSWKFPSQPPLCQVENEVINVIATDWVQTIQTKRRLLSHHFILWTR